MFIDIPLGFICFSRTKVMHMYVFVYFILRRSISMGGHLLDSIVTADHSFLNGNSGSCDTACL